MNKGQLTVSITGDLTSIASTRTIHEWELKEKKQDHKSIKK